MIKTSVFIMIRIFFYVWLICFRAGDSIIREHGDNKDPICMQAFVSRASVYEYHTTAQAGRALILHAAMLSIAKNAKLYISFNKLT